jgi:HK97 family phage major capsid protein
MTTSVETSVRAYRDELQSKMDRLLHKVEREKRTHLSKDEDTNFQALLKDREAADVRLAELDKERATRAAVTAMHAKIGTREMTNTASVSVGREPLTYRHDSRDSWVRDLWQRQNYNDPEAALRLQRHGNEVRAITTVDGAGGELVPPLWLVNQAIGYPRPGRVVAPLMNQSPMPAGTDSINLPKIATGTATAEQTTQNTTLQNTDITSSSVSSAVRTIGGLQILSVQLLEQAGIPNLDQIILGDLLRDYDRQLETELINGATGSGQLAGILNVASINAVTYTSASPTGYGLYSKIADAVQRIASGVYGSPTALIMTPARWAFLATALDSQNRPLVVPAGIGGAGATNTIATTMGELGQGHVGYAFGLPVYVTASVPTNLGAGTNEDRIIVAKWDELFLYEGTARAEMFRETKADQGSVLLRVYNYVAAIPQRLPKSISVISGTGLVTPTF